MTAPTFFVDELAVIARSTEVPEASFVNGANLAASNACGIGINMEGGAVVGTPAQFTVTDQRGQARDPQCSQSLGGFPYADPADYPSSGGTENLLPSDFDVPILTGTMPTTAEKEANPSIDGEAVITGTATISDAATGWVGGVVPTP